MPLISILMSVYNGQECLERAVRSILAQTLDDFELIIVDDGSTDGTGEVLSRLASADARVRPVELRRNRGLAAALNEAFRHSSGQLIARMDADDFSLSDRLERQAKYLAEHHDIDVLGTASFVVDRDGRRTGIFNRPELHQELVARIYKENPFIHPSVMLRRHVFEALSGYDESYRRAQDYDLWLRAYRRFRFHNLADALVEYRRPEAMTWLSSVSGARAILSAGFRDTAPVRGVFFAARLLVAFAVFRFRGSPRALR